MDTVPKRPRGGTWRPPTGGAPIIRRGDAPPRSLPLPSIRDPQRTPRRRGDRRRRVRADTRRNGRRRRGKERGRGRDIDALGVVLIAASTLPLLARGDTHRSRSSSRPRRRATSSTGSTLAGRRSVRRSPYSARSRPDGARHGPGCGRGGRRGSSSRTSRGGIAAQFPGMPRCSAASVGRRVGPGRPVRMRRVRTERVRSGRSGPPSGGRLAVAEERMRIARDLHDSAGHAINVILVQAGAARLLSDGTRARATELETIERSPARRSARSTSSWPCCGTRAWPARMSRRRSASLHSTHSSDATGRTEWRSPSRWKERPGHSRCSGPGGVPDPPGGPHEVGRHGEARPTSSVEYKPRALTVAVANARRRGAPRRGRATASRACASARPARRDARGGRRATAASASRADCPTAGDR